MSSSMLYIHVNVYTSSHVVMTTQDGPRPVTSCVISRNDRYMLTAGADWTVRMWDIASGKQIKCLEGITYKVSNIEHSRSYYTYIVT